jgi:hypothetical protein
MAERVATGELGVERAQGRFASGGGVPLLTRQLSTDRLEHPLRPMLAVRPYEIFVTWGAKPRLCRISSKTKPG